MSGLTAFRDQPARVDEWVIAFSEAAAGNAVRLSEQIRELDERMRDEYIVYRRRSGVNSSSP